MKVSRKFRTQASSYFNILLFGTNTVTVPVLAAEECLLIAKNAYWTQNYYYTAVWCEAAWKLVRNGDETADSVEILDYFSIAVSRLG